MIGRGIRSIKSLKELELAGFSDKPDAIAKEIGKKRRLLTTFLMGLHSTASKLKEREQKASIPFSDHTPASISEPN